MDRFCARHAEISTAPRRNRVGHRQWAARFLPAPSLREVINTKMVGGSGFCNGGKIVYLLDRIVGAKIDRYFWIDFRVQVIA